MPSSSSQPQHVVIVGAGMAGLTCARTLLEQSEHDNVDIRVTLLEANPQVGGRVYANCDFLPGVPLDLGAEYIRGTGTLLTDYLQEFQRGNLLHAPPAALAYQREQQKQSVQLKKKKKAMRKKQRREERLKQEQQRKAMQRQQSFLLRQKLAQAKQQASKQKITQQEDDSIVVFNANESTDSNNFGSNKGMTKFSGGASIPSSLEDSFANDDEPTSASESEHKESGNVFKSIPEEEEGEDAVERVQEHVRRTSLNLKVGSVRHVNAENNQSNATTNLYRRSDEDDDEDDGGAKAKLGGDAKEHYSYLDEDYDETERQEQEDKLITSIHDDGEDDDEDDDDDDLDDEDEFGDDSASSSNNQSNNSNNMSLEQIFIASHADGGPQTSPTSKEGKYAMYYFLEQLLPYSDEQWIHPLTLAVEQMMKVPIQDMDYSVALHDVLIQQLQETIMSFDDDNDEKYADERENDEEKRPASGKPTRVDHLTELYNLAVASFGNTVTLTDLTQLSLPMLRKFEHYWATNHDSHANYRMPTQLGMYSIAQALQMQLEMAYGGESKGTEVTSSGPRFELILNAPVQEVVEENGGVTVTYLPPAHKGKPAVVRVDRVVVAVPPPVLPRILPDLTPAKKEALDYVSFSNIVRVVCKFSSRFWPDQVQTVISAEGMFPELRLRSIHVGQDHYHLVMFYLSDEFANTFVEECQFENMAEESSYAWDKGKATQLCLEHLVKVLELGNQRASVLTVDDLHALMVDILIHDWKSHPYVEGGQLAPKVGMTSGHLKALAEPLGSRIHFCGEATNTNACGTIQAAMETGVRAAEEALEPPIDEEVEDDDDDDDFTEIEVEESEHDAIDGEDEPMLQGSPGHVRQQIDRIESQSKLRVVETPPVKTASRTNVAETFDPTNVAQLIQLQMGIARNLAKQEEESFSMIRAMEERQLEVSRALSDQEQASFLMIQTIEELTAKVQFYESQAMNGEPYKLFPDESDNASISSEAKWRDDKVRILQAHEAQSEKFQSLQTEWQDLQQKVTEKDTLLREQESMIEELTRKMKEMESKPKQDDRVLKKHEATVKQLKHKIKTMQGQLNDSKKEHDAAIAMVRHRDRVIKYMKQHERKGDPSNTGRIRKQKAAREEKLKGIMSRIVCSKQNIRHQKEMAMMDTMSSQLNPMPSQLAPSQKPTYVTVQGTNKTSGPALGALADPEASLENSSVEKESLPWETEKYDGVKGGEGP